MKHTAAVLLVWFAAWSGLPARAQRQTGAPAGIPVPAPPTEAQAGLSGEQPIVSAVFRIHLVNGRNGDPMRNAHVTLWYDEQQGPGTLLTTDEHGDAAMPAPLGQPGRVLVRLADLVDCSVTATQEPLAGFNLQAIAQHGESASNRCGVVGKHAAPGELVLFARSPRWYEGINQGGATR